MEEKEGLEKLFFELASATRLGIIRLVQTQPLKMKEIGKKLDLTDTEVFRQLHRLSEAQLIEKRVDGAYSLTQYGRLILQLSKSFDFVSHNKQCFMTRDVWRLPEQFINRLGELSASKLNVDLIESINNSVLAIDEAEEHIWVIGEKPSTPLGAKIAERASKGVKVRVLFPEASRSYYKDIPEIKGVFEKRMIPMLPATMVCTEKAAGVNLLSNDGRMDNVLFYGRDLELLRWAKDLFLYYWDLARP